ncbi:AP2-associated protein kinase 1-like [Phoenix dactylifera]|uniref:non-specific serine/threonine protein kinase n=1 Tax=Phoenix dactylifera TaxID=42345 RepID=A0A8B7CWV3_PHODC|nr:AP2-associated protein kinase 1-like [Phoenix dactylifera]XP_008808089.1 AP2-associated protein kinase 1-like [Phoenix dactylifera]XP_038972061.1 AP2-associated protein kinase 1-like [Phoenix dactylifera]
MWRFKPFTAKEPTGLEGRTIDVGNVKVHVRNAMAEGGFSCVYLARDALHASKQYALKHMICNDGESLDLAMKEISVMRLLKGHPNVVALVAHTILDMGRMKEVLIVMEFCEKSLVAVLDNRGAGYFEENQVLLIFRDVCNAVLAMHSQSPPIAHRDLKAENVLLGSDGAWKLCDFGSTSTNHKCFDRPEEMGIEEDNIRKHTTPAYRAPEMWDLFRREIISEKVDIWALGCLLYRICYLKSAFDGESKLQILNGNYRIPELPKYSAAITNLIKDMLEASPNARPDITQVWFRVNEQLPVELQKYLPDGSSSNISMYHPTSSMHDEGLPKKYLMPRRSPPPPPSSREQMQNISVQSEKVSHSRPSQGGSKAAGCPIGSFWSTQYAHDPQVAENKGSLIDKEPFKQWRSKNNQNSLDSKTISPREHVHTGQSGAANPLKKFEEDPSKGFEISFFQEEPQQNSQKTKAVHPETIQTFQNEAFNTFIAEFETSNLDSRNSASNNHNNGSGRKELEAEADRLKEQLKQANLGKAEITSKYEKLSAICRSQRQEIQELKRALAAATPSPSSKDSSKSHISLGSLQSGTLQKDKIEGTVWELQQGMLANSSPSPSQEPKPWQAFSGEPKAQSRAAGTTNGHQNLTKQSAAAPSSDVWGFNLESFTAAPFGAQVSRTSAQANTSQRLSGGGTKKVETSQPSGWAGF